MSHATRFIETWNHDLDQVKQLTAKEVAIHQRNFQFISVFFQDVLDVLNANHASRQENIARANQLKERYINLFKDEDFLHMVGELLTTVLVGIEQNSTLILNYARRITFLAQETSLTSSLFSTSPLTKSIAQTQRLTTRSLYRSSVLSR